jgi:GTPase SAR1 family protein
LITVEDVMDELGYGPNGGLIFCMEYLLDNLDWLEESIGTYEDDYIIFDCPGQIELYTHFPVMRKITDALQRWDFRVVGIYLLDSMFVQDTAKYFAGVLTALSAMVQLEIPHINIMTKIDLIEKKGFQRHMERHYEVDPSLLLEDVNLQTSKRLFQLNEKLSYLVSNL